VFLPSGSRYRKIPASLREDYHRRLRHTIISSCKFPRGARQESEESCLRHASGKSRTDFAAFTARLKPCPTKITALLTFMSRPHPRGIVCRKIANRCKLCWTLKDFPRGMRPRALDSARISLAQIDGDDPQSYLAGNHRGRGLAVAIPLDRVTPKSQAQHADGSGRDGLPAGPFISGHLADRRFASGNHAYGRGIGKTKCLPDRGQLFPRASLNRKLGNTPGSWDDFEALRCTQFSHYRIYSPR